MVLKDTIDKYMNSEVEIFNTLKKIKEKEPHVETEKTLILRGNICGYELGDIQRAIMMYSRKGLPENVRNGYLENGKLGMADLVTQLRMICIEMEWSFKDIQAMGIEHLKERHIELKKDGWSD